jgi:hypothetical protein
MLVVYTALFFMLSVTMEQHIFAFLLIIEGTTEKLLQFKIPLKSIYNQNISFIEQILYFLNTTDRFKQ